MRFILPYTNQHGVTRILTDGNASVKKFKSNTSGQTVPIPATSSIPKEANESSQIQEKATTVLHASSCLFPLFSDDLSTNRSFASYQPSRRRFIHIKRVARTIHVNQFETVLNVMHVNEENLISTMVETAGLNLPTINQ